MSDYVDALSKFDYDEARNYLNELDEIKAERCLWSVLAALAVIETTTPMATMTKSRQNLATSSLMVLVRTPAGVVQHQVHRPNLVRASVSEGFP